MKSLRALGFGLVVGTVALVAAGSKEGVMSAGVRPSIDGAVPVAVERAVFALG